MWTFEHTETTTATPAQVWARYAEPATWPEWDRETAAVTVQGPFTHRVTRRGPLSPLFARVRWLAGGQAFCRVRPGLRG